ncbi:MAG: glycosyltransferase family 39 protein [Proteobacteria bacterium]|nr:glycosyltransferase family 39 protein [Burkholderiales bacterium]
MAPTPRLFSAPDDRADEARNRLHALFTVLLCGTWVFTGLVAHDPWKPDEAYTFGLVLHILQTGDWIVPTLAGEPFMEKPPIFFITAAAFAGVFGSLLELHDAARLAAGFYLCVVLFFVGLSARELYGREHAWVAPLALIGCVGLLIRAHQMITDTALLAGFAIGLYGLCLGLRRPAWAGIALGTGAGLGFMAKGLLAPAVLGLCALLLPVLFRTWRHRAHAWTLLAACAAILPWLIVWPWALRNRSLELFNEWFWVNNFGRFLGLNDLGPESAPGEYFVMMLWYAWPALPLAGWMLWQRGREVLRTPQLQLPMLVFVVTFATLSISADARELYAMPMLLPLSLLAAASIDGLRRSAANFLDWFGIMTFGLLAFVLWTGYVALLTGWPEQLARQLAEVHPGFDARFDPWSLVAGMAATLVWIGLVWRVGRSNRRAIVNWAAGLTLFWALTNLFFLAYIDHGKSYRGMIAELNVHLPQQYRCVASQTLGESQRALLDYFAGLKTRSVERSRAAAEECDVYLWQGWAWDDEALSAPWVKVWEGARPGDRKELYRLYQRPAG